jgi:SAM-dependent methyltransferase
MPLDATPSGIFEWIARSSRPRLSDSATLRFERMESQAAFGLPEVHKPLDHHNPSHWHHRGMIWDYVLSLAGAERVLDVGPGDGWPSLLIAPHFKEVVGIEPGSRRVAACKSNAHRMGLRKAHFEQMSVEAMTFRAGSFDGVVAATSIEQTSDPAAALSEVHRVLAAGGELRLTYEALELSPEPVRETIAVLRGPEEGTYLIDYVVAWSRRYEERNFLIEVKPANESSAKRLELWAARCAEDRFPLRDPRLERGLVRTIRALRMGEVVRVETYRVHHFKTDALLKLLAKTGFTDARCIAGGGLPAAQCGLEMVQSRRIEAAAPLMEEMCRAAARFGITVETTRPGNVIARKPRGRAKSARSS